MAAIGIGLSPVLGSKAAAVVLAAPANLALSITGAAFDVITATWDAVSGAATYEVEYSDDGVTYTAVDTTALLTYDITSADYDVGAVAHYIRVRAVGGAWAVATIANPYLLLDRYTDTDAAPITTPRTALVGAFDVVDDNTYIFTNGAGLHHGLVLHNPTGADTTAWGEAQIVSASSIPRAQGRVLAALVTLEDAVGGFALYWSAAGTQGENPTSVGGEGWINYSGELRALVPGGVVLAGGDIQDVRPGQYLVAVVLQATGYYVLLSSFGNELGLQATDPVGIPAYPSARVVWVNQTATTADLYPTLQFKDIYGYPRGTTVQGLRVIDAAEAAYTADNGVAVIADRFTRADSNVSLGGSWATDAGTWGIVSNQGKLITPSGFSRAYLTAQADCVVQCTITTPADMTSAAWGLMLRRVDSGNFLRLWNNFTSNTLTLQHWTGGGFGGTIYGSAFTWNAATSYTIVVYMKDNKYHILVNGAAFTSDWTADAGSNHITGTGMGLYGGAGANQATYDNFAVYPHTVTLPAVLAADAIPTVVTAGATLAEDTFTDTNGVSLAAHTAEDGGAWTVHNGTIEIQSNAAVVDAYTSNLAQATQDTGESDVEVQVDIITPGSWNAEGRLRSGLLVRYLDASNYIDVRLFRDNAQAGTDEIEITEIVAGAGGVSHKCQFNALYQVATTYTLKIQAIGNLLMCWLDADDGNGLRPCQAFLMNSALANATRFGLHQDDIDSGAAFDNWSVKVL